MSEFEFLFALFGLLLGLSLTEVLGGLGRAIEARLRLGAVIRIGWLTPLLGTFVLLDLLSFWGAAWVTRDVIAVSGLSLMGVTAFASAYYLASHLVFPRDVENVRDFDDHFFRVRRVVIGVMLVLLLCQLGWYASVPDLRAVLDNLPVQIFTAILIVLMVAAMLVRSPLWTRWVMAALVARYLVVYAI